MDTEVTQPLDESSKNDDVSSSADPSDNEDNPVTDKDQDTTAGSPLSKKARRAAAREKRYENFRMYRHQRRKEARKRRQDERQRLKAEGVPLEQLPRLSNRPKQSQVVPMRESKCKIRVVVDCSFDSLMSEKEVAKLHNQLSNMYGINRRAANPIQFYVTSLCGYLKQRLENTNGGEHHNWDLYFHEKHFLEVFCGVSHVTTLLTQDKSANTLTSQDSSTSAITSKDNSTSAMTLKDNSTSAMTSQDSSTNAMTSQDKCTSAMTSQDNFTAMTSYSTSVIISQDNFTNTVTSLSDVTSTVTSNPNQSSVSIIEPVQNTSKPSDCADSASLLVSASTESDATSNDNSADRTPTTKLSTVSCVGSPAELLPFSKIVYLCAESPNVLPSKLDPSCVYVLGGLVDHNRLKGHCYQLACHLGLSTARLPIGVGTGSDSAPDQMEAIRLNQRAVLSLVHVFDALLCVTEHNDWTEALKKAIPARKQL